MMINQILAQPECFTRVLSFVDLPDFSSISQVCQIFSASVRGFLAGNDRQALADFLDKFQDRIHVKNRFELIKNCKDQLSNINLADSYLTEQELDEYATSCPNLISVNLTNCRNLTNSGLQNLLQKVLYLQKLHLTNCKQITTVTFPGMQGKFQHFQELHLSGTGLTHIKVQEVIAECFSLRRLTLMGITITDETVKQIAQKHLHLEQLTISGRISDNGVKVIAENLHHLRHLSLSSSTITDDGIEELTKERQPFLETVEFPSCRNITNDGIEKLVKKFTSLQELNLYDTLATAKTIPYHLQKLNLRACSLRNLSDALYNGLPMLQELILRSASISNEAIIVIIEKHLTLKVLDLDYCQANTEVVITIAKKLSKLQKLLLVDCEAIPSAFLELAEGVPDLQELDISWSRIKDVGFKRLLKKLLKLRKVRFSRNRITSKGIKAFAKKFKNLSAADLSATSIGDDGIKELVTRHPNLKELRLGFCSKMSAQAVIMVAESLPKLQVLDLEGFKKLTQQVIQAIVEKLSDLQELYLTNTNMTDAFLSIIGNHSPKLRILNIKDCTKINPVQISALKQARPYLQVITQ